MSLHRLVANEGGGAKVYRDLQKLFSDEAQGAGGAWEPVCSQGCDCYGSGPARTSECSAHQATNPAVLCGHGLRGLCCFPHLLLLVAFRLGDLGDIALVRRSRRHTVPSRSATHREVFLPWVARSPP